MANLPATPGGDKPLATPCARTGDHEPSIAAASRGALVQALGAILEHEVPRLAQGGRFDCPWIAPADAREMARDLLDTLAAAGFALTRRAGA